MKGLNLKKWFFITTAFWWGWDSVGHAQTIPAGFPVLEEYARRKNQLGKDFIENSFSLRPIKASLKDLFGKELQPDTISNSVDRGFQIELLPILNTTIYNSNRPIGWGHSSLFNAAGFQQLTSPGIFMKVGILEIQLRPEWVYSQNKSYRGYGDQFSDEIDFARFRFWNFGDHPENFGKSYNHFATWGQSYISLNFGKIEAGFGTQNIWWGPGQFSSLIFSNNARGIKHIYLKTSSPINIGIGHLESQFIAGRAEDSGLSPSQNQSLNEQYFLDFSGDWRYITGLSVTYQPKFLKNFFIGFNRTFQQYNEQVEKSFVGRFPIFESFQKDKVFEGGNSVIYDGLAQDQQVSMFFRFKSPNGKAEIYSEFGKRDHNLNWREFILNPEHARAYLVGFTKLFSTPKEGAFLQLRGEIIQQSESVNRYLRYPVLGVSNTSWHTHYQVRGFTNFGQSMGAGMGVGSNAQILELSRIRNIDKIGIQFQRIENHQDFFYLAKIRGEKDIGPWIDLNFAILFDHQWNNLIFSSKIQATHAINYQWLLSEGSSSTFPSGYILNTASFQFNLIYLIGK